MGSLFIMYSESIVLCEQNEQNNQYIFYKVYIVNGYIYENILYNH